MCIRDSLKGGNVAPVANADRATVFVGRAATAVSYTHLDVYKRQARVTAQVIDTAALKLSGAAALTGTTVSQGRGTYVVADAAAGRVWAMPVGEVPTFTRDAVPAIKDFPGARALATAEGSVVAWDKDGHVRRLERLGTTWRSVEVGTLAGGAPELSLIHI